MYFGLLRLALDAVATNRDMYIELKFDRLENDT